MYQVHIRYILQNLRSHSWSEFYCYNVRYIGEFRQNIGSHSWSVFYFYIIRYFVYIRHILCTYYIILWLLRVYHVYIILCVYYLYNVPVLCMKGT